MAFNAANNTEKSLPWGDLHPIQYVVSWAHLRLHPKRHLDRFIYFCTAYRSVPILYNGPPLPPKIIAPSFWDRAPSNTWFLGPTQVTTPNGISIGSAVFYRAQRYNRQTDHVHATPGCFLKIISCRLTTLLQLTIG